MPIHTCTRGGKKGRQWGKSGKCYVGVHGKARAARQAAAVRASGWTGNASDCGAGVEGDSGFQEGNTCGRSKGGGSPVRGRAIAFDENPWKFAKYRDAPDLQREITDMNGAKTVRAELKRRGRLNADGKTVSLYHITLPEYASSIEKEGLVPAKEEAPGQPWKAEHSSYATYFYLDKGVALDHAEQAGGMKVVEARIPITPKSLIRILPDEDSSPNPKDGVKVLLEGGTVAYIGGIPSSHVSVINAAVSRKRRPNPLCADPTRTASLRRRFTAALRRKFRNIRATIRRALVEHDVLGLAMNAERFTFRTTPERQQAFLRWLKAMVEQELLDVSDPYDREAYWRAYVEDGFRQGAGRAFDDVHKLAKGNPEIAQWYQGTRAEFLTSAFMQPVAVDRVKLLAGRVFTELDGVSQYMATRMNRSLSDSMARGRGAVDAMRALAEDANLSEQRALLVARTEIVRAHAEGQLTAMEEMGVGAVGVMVEWDTAQDDRVCKACEPLQGVVLTIEEARGMIPRHPNCRCAYLPANVGESERGQKRGAEEIDDAMEESLAAAGQTREKSLWQGADLVPAETRPTSALNVFCPTGEGGGVDPTCSPSESGLPKLSHREEVMVGKYLGESTGVAYKLNSMLRKGERPRDVDYQLGLVQEGMDSAIAKQKTSRDAVVYRGVSTDAISRDTKVGDTVVDRGYSSTDTSKEVADRFGYVLMRIALPKGSTAMPVPAYQIGSQKINENEMLLPRGSRFLVNGVSMSEYGHPIYDMTWQGVDLQVAVARPEASL